MRMALNQVHSGWLTKSPPEKKHQGRLKLFKAQWRRRYFVLSSCQSQSPGGGGGGEVAPPVFYLHYYDNDKNPKKSRKKGCIDLTSCEEILAELDSDGHGNVFSLRTQHKGRTRTYSLAADSVEEMNQWIGCLIQALHMDDSNFSFSRPETPGGNFLSSPKRKASYPQKRNDQASPNQLSISSPSPAIHSSVLVDTQSSFSAELAETRHGPRGSQGHFSPLVPAACFHFFPLESIKDLPPPSLPAKSLQRRCHDPCAPLDDAASGSSSGHSEKESEHRRMSEDLGPRDYDVLPTAFRKVKASKGSDYDFPPPGLLTGSGKTSKYASLSDVPSQRESTSSHSDVFESLEDLVSHLQSETSPKTLQPTSSTRSFPRSTARSNPQTPNTPMSVDQDQGASRSGSEDVEDYEHLQRNDDYEYTNLFRNS